MLVAAAFLVGLSKTGIPGLGILFIAIFNNLMPVKEATGLVLPFLLMGDCVAVFLYKRHATWRYIFRLFPWTAIGVLFGFLTLGRIDNAEARLLVGGILLGMLGLHLWRSSSRGGQALESEVSEYGRWFAPLIGILAGFTTLVANAAGPVMVLFFLAMRLPKMEFIGTGAVFFLIVNLFKIPFIADLGLINSGSLQINLVLAPVVFFGTWAGRAVFRRIDQRWFERVALVLTLVASIRLLVH